MQVDIKAVPMSPRAIEAADWLERVDAFLALPQAYRTVPPADYSDAALGWAFPPQVRERFVEHFREYGMTDWRLWSDAAWSVGYDETLDVVWFRLLVKVSGREALPAAETISAGMH